MKVNREDIAWAAGLFDGEGWISIDGKAPSIGIQMGDPDLLVRIQHVLCMGHIHPRAISLHGKDSLSIRSRKPRWSWRVTGFEFVQAALAVMWPWLSIRRQQRAKEVLNVAKVGKATKRRQYKVHPTMDLTLYTEPNNEPQP